MSWIPVRTTNGWTARRRFGTFDDGGEAVGVEVRQNYPPSITTWPADDYYRMFEFTYTATLDTSGGMTSVVLEWAANGADGANTIPTMTINGSTAPAASTVTGSNFHKYSTWNVTGLPSTVPSVVFKWENVDDPMYLIHLYGIERTPAFALPAGPPNLNVVREGANRDFSWGLSSPAADSFELQFDNANPEITNSAVNTSRTVRYSPQFEPDYFVGDPHRYRVRGIKDGYESAWSELHEGIVVGYGSLSATRTVVTVPAVTAPLTGTGTLTAAVAVAQDDLYGTVVLADSPQVYYPCQETSGTVLTDASGNGRNGTIAAGAVVSDATDPAPPGALGKHIRLDGTSGHLALNGTYSIAQNNTIEGWFYFRAWQDWVRVYDFANASGQQDLVYGRSGNSGPVMFLNSSNSNDGANHPLNQWTHIAITTNTTTGHTIYVNGVATVTKGYMARDAGARQFSYIGRSSYPSDPYLQASVTRVAVYNSTLTSTRVAEHYNTGAGIEIPSVTGPLTGDGALTATVEAIEGGQPEGAYPVEIVQVGSSSPITLTITETPLAGDVVLVAVATNSSGGRSVTSMTGLGGTWQAVHTGNRCHLWKCTNATTSGNVTVTLNISTTSEAVAYVVRGASGSPIRTVLGTTTTTGPALIATAGQFVGQATGSSVTGSITATQPIADWTVLPASSAYNQHAYRTVTEEIGTTHRLTTSGSGSLEHLLFAIGDVPTGGDYAHEVLADQPLSYYRLNEPSGTNMTDSSGGAHNGTYTVVPTLDVPGLLTGNPDTAADFQGGSTGAYATVSTGTWMDSATLTVEAWIKRESTAGDAYIACRDNNGAARNWRLKVNNVNGIIDFAVWNATGSVVVLTPSGAGVVTAPDVVHHVVGTYDGTTMRLYLDGAQIGSANHTGAARTTAQNVNIGSFGSSTSSRFNGVLDEVAYYGTALPANRVLAHYEAGTAATPTPQVTAPLAGTGVLAATVSVSTVPQVTAPLAGDGTLAATVEPVALSTASLTGSGELSAEVQTTETPNVTADLAGTGTFTATVTSALSIPARAADLAGTGLLSAVVRRVITAVDEPRSTTRWMLRDTATGVEWVMPINPDSMGSPLPRRQLKFGYGWREDGRIRTFSSSREPIEWEWSGVIRSKDHYDRLVEWAEKSVAVEVTDHLARTFRVFITEFNPTDRRPTPNTPWRLRYAMKALILERVE